MKVSTSAGASAQGPTVWFTGAVYIDGIRNPDEHSAVGRAHVRLMPGARTAWHHHPKGQTCTSWTALAGWRRGGGVQEIRPRDCGVHRAGGGALTRSGFRPLHGARRHPGSGRQRQGRDVARPPNR